MSVPTFVVGTGRCGSTMLSNMLREHPQVLSLSEFFSMISDAGFRLPQMFSAEPLDGSVLPCMMRPLQHATPNRGDGRVEQACCSLMNKQPRPL